MKRSALKRKTPLARGTATLKRTVLRPRPENRKRKATIPAAVRAAVKARSGGRCVMCAWLDSRPLAILRRGGRIAHLHHVLDEHQWPEYAQEERNLVGLCFDCHWAHHFPGVNARRVAWEALPPEVVAWVCSRGGREQAYISRFYPRQSVRGVLGVSGR